MNKLYLAICCFLFAACSAEKKIGRSAERLLFSDTTISNAHIGISIFDVSANKFIYNYQADKYFVPASNTKIFTTYAGLKYLGDSLPGIQYLEKGDTIHLFPTGDPTFLHKDFPVQPVMDFLKNSQKRLTITGSNWKDAPFGFGWSWDDYNSSYMAERSPMPVYGNTIRFVQTQQTSEASAEKEPFIFTEPEINWKLNFDPGSSKTFSVRRIRNDNVFRVSQGTEQYKEVEVPFITNGLASTLELLKDTVQREIILVDGNNDINESQPASRTSNLTLKTVFSQPTDSFLRIMMHRSDNFFAEQTLLMVSNLKLGVMDDGHLISTMLKSDLKDAPQQPRWVDGSGLSRYNLFTPRDFVWILNKMKTEFSFERLKGIFPTGGQGTLRNFYRSDSTSLFAKTGTLSGHVALSGYLTTRKQKTLIFSVLVNNHHGTAASIRRQVEQFLQGISNKY
ncbi:MAG TPA: D-alanyl-D-alanine carboxypeptidase/D-alanyl-D-alanine-endopeptidase [Chitinophagaceae bacterium]